MSNKVKKSVYVCTRHKEKATQKNLELDALILQLVEYQEILQSIMGTIGENFPNELTFYTGVSYIVRKIDTEITAFNASIATMKKSSLTNARIKDNQETLRNMTYQTEEGYND